MVPQAGVEVHFAVGPAPRDCQTGAVRGKSELVSAARGIELFVWVDLYRQVDQRAGLRGAGGVVEQDTRDEEGASKPQRPTAPPSPPPAPLDITAQLDERSRAALAGAPVLRSGQAQKVLLAIR